MLVGYPIFHDLILLEFYTRLFIIPKITLMNLYFPVYVLYELSIARSGFVLFAIIVHTRIHLFMIRIDIV